MWWKWFLALFAFVCLLVPHSDGTAGDKDVIPLGKKSSKTPVVDPALPMEQGNVAAEASDEVKPYIASLGVYGSPRLQEAAMKQTLGADLDKWIQLGLAGDERSLALEEKLAKRIQDKFGFAEVAWSVIQFFEPGDFAVHITLDVVEREDVKRRKPFHPEPTREFQDPDKLLQMWSEYENTALDLIDAGLLEPGVEKCQAFHCPFGHKHEKLKKYEQVFVTGVQKHEKLLVQILNEDKRADYRGAAAYLLPYLKDGAKVVSYMADRIRDPDELVRNNALRVLGDIAEFHSQFVIPVQPVAQALAFPRASDRSKALYLAYLMALNSQQMRDQLLKTSVPDLLSLLAAKQPDHREFAHSILRKISAKEYAMNDIASWEQWFKKLPKDRTVSNQK